MKYLVEIPTDLLGELEIIKLKTGTPVQKQIMNVTMDWVSRFHNLDPLPIDGVIRSYDSPLGPQGYQRANYLAEVLRIKRNILRKENIRYPKYFSERFLPQCKYRFELRRVCIDYERRRTHYQCDQVCLKSPDLVAARGAERCMYLKSKYTHGKVFDTHFIHSVINNCA